jgi:hypothetical protein
VTTGSEMGPAESDVAPARTADARTGPRADGTSRAVDALVPPIAAFGLAQLALWLGARWAGVPAGTTVSWFRYDSGLYAQIQARGYDLVPCSQVAGMEASPGWCGTAGWFPGYPALVRLVRRLGFDDDLWVMAAIPRVAHLVLLAAIWWWIGTRRGRTWRDGAVLAPVALCPGVVYLSAPFPLAQATLALTVALAALARGRPLLGGLAAALAVFSYPTAALVIPAALLWLAWERPARTPFAVARAGALFAVPAIVGGVAALGVIGEATGTWRAWFRVQAKYQEGSSQISAPIVGVLERIGRVVHPASDVERVTAFEAALVGLVVVACVAVTWARRAEVRPIDRLLACWLAVAWLVPPMLGESRSVYRYDALLAPGLVLVALLPRWARVATTGALAALAVAIAREYFAGTLV